MSCRTLLSFLAALSITTACDPRRPDGSETSALLGYTPSNVLLTADLFDGVGDVVLDDDRCTIGAVAPGRLNCGSDLDGYQISEGIGTEGDTLRIVTLRSLLVTEGSVVEVSGDEPLVIVALDSIDIQGELLVQYGELGGATTSGSGGIGLEMARLLAPRGHRLVLASRDPGRLQAAADELRRAHGAEVHAHAIDLSEPGAAQRLFDHTQRQGLHIDALVNNAGFGAIEEHVAIDAVQLQRMLQLDVVAVAELCHRYGGAMKHRRAGRILNVASTAAFQPTPYFAAYGAAKAFVLNFSEALAMELEDHGVSVCCLAPGPTDTAFFDTLDPRRVSGGHFFGKAGRADPREVAAAGVALMLGGGLTRVVGLRNRLMILGNRFVPRSMVATVSKRMLRPLDVAKDAK